MKLRELHNDRNTFLLKFTEGLQAMTNFWQNVDFVVSSKQRKKCGSKCTKNRIKNSINYSKFTESLFSFFQINGVSEIIIKECSQQKNFTPPENY